LRKQIQLRQTDLHSIGSTLSTFWLEAYDGLSTRGLWMPGPWGARLNVGGGDRIPFLQNFTTNDVTPVASGEVVETFFLNAKGHVVAHALLAARESTIQVYPLGSPAEDLLAHLGTFVVREDVTFHVDSSPWWLAIGGASSGVEQPGAATSRGPLLPDLEVEVYPCPLFSPTVWMLESNASQERLEMTLEQSGFYRPDGGVVAQVVYDALRIEGGIPLRRVDYFAGTLPQELGRNTTALNFSKGCYLGQETVARLDALGHVNRVLRGIQFEEDSYPYPGIVLNGGGREVGAVTSLTYSPLLKTSLGMALIRRESAAPGTELTWANGRATAIEFPGGPAV
jgi:folate-binding protein YgfZ